MKLKTVEIDGKTYAEVQDGKPVFTGDDGKEVAFDAPATVQTISRLNGEAMGHRQAKEQAEAKLKAYEGIDDPAAAKKALETVANLDAGKLLEAGKADEIKREAQKAAEAQVEAATKALKDQLAEMTGSRDKLAGQLDDAMIGGAFKGSKFITDKVAIPPHLLQNTYGKNFKVEDGKLVPYDANGNKVFSRAKPGELADFDEAMELFISADPFKDSILKGTGHSGTGASGGTGGANGAKTMSRAEFEKLDPAGRARTMADKVQLVD